MKYVVTCSAMLALFAFAGCSQPSVTEDGDTVTTGDVKEEVTEAVEATNELVKENRDAYVAKVEKELAVLDEEVDALQVKAQEKGAALLDDVQARLDGLKAKRDAVSDELDGLKAAGSDVWADLRDGVDAALTELRGAVSEVSANVADS